MDEITYNGSTYRRYTSKWCSSTGIAVPESLQRTLNHEWSKTHGAGTMSADELVLEADRLFESGSYSAAAKYYESACEADFTSARVASVLPRISSCYRRARCPERAIELFGYASRQLGREIVTHELLTSAGAAYCDLGEYEKARRCCNRAYAALGGCATDELSAVYRRIDREMTK